MKIAQTTIEFLLITLTAIVLAIVITDKLNLVDFAKKTIFVNSSERGKAEVPPMVP